jgi:hypothetical protein
MAWMPTPRPEVLKMAVPETSVTVPRAVAPSLIVTLPVGVNEDEAVGLTVTVKVTSCPKTDVAKDEEIAVVVDAPPVAVPAFSFATNASSVPPPKAAWIGVAPSGKFVDWVWPEIKISFDASSAMASARSAPLPPRYVE